MGTIDDPAFASRPFSALADPRKHGKVLYPLREIMLLILCGTLAGAGDFEDVRAWGRK